MLLTSFGISHHQISLFSCSGSRNPQNRHVDMVSSWWPSPSTGSWNCHIIPRMNPWRSRSSPYIRQCTSSSAGVWRWPPSPPEWAPSPTSARNSWCLLECAHPWSSQSDHKWESSSLVFSPAYHSPAWPDPQSRTLVHHYRQSHNLVVHLNCHYLAVFGPLWLWNFEDLIYLHFNFKFNHRPNWCFGHLWSNYLDGCPNHLDVQIHLDGGPWKFSDLLYGWWVYLSIHHQPSQSWRMLVFTPSWSAHQPQCSSSSWS